MVYETGPVRTNLVVVEQVYEPVVAMVQVVPHCACAVWGSSPASSSSSRHHDRDDRCGSSRCGKRQALSE